MKHASDVRNLTWITFDHFELKCFRRFKIILINYSYLYIVGKVYVNNSLCLQFYTTFYNSLFHTNYMFSILIPILISVFIQDFVNKDIFSIVIWFYFIFTILNPKKSWILAKCEVCMEGLLRVTDHRHRPSSQLWTSSFMALSKMQL